jgi:Ca2+-binding EF-hand superfamily protein
LSEACRLKVHETFNSFDLDHSNAIDKEEAIKHWKGAFAKINALEFFSAVDVNNDGTITFEEFENFWKVVRGAGHTEEEIIQELQTI